MTRCFIEPDFAAGSIANDARVTSSTTDPATGNNTSGQTITEVNTYHDLGVVKTASPVPAIPGEELTYTVTVTNYGPSDALDLTITDNLPPEVAFSRQWEVL